MANHGGGNKFVSVNLNKSYGKPGSLGGSGGGRARPSGHGGMVALSRPRSLVSYGQKGPRLSVPSPLNLPSLRKEHERIDSSSSCLVGSGAAALGLGSASSGMGWTKPQLLRTGESDVRAVSDAGRIATANGSVAHQQGGSGGEDVVRRANAYLPPENRATVAAPPGPPNVGYQPVEKALLLRGEDFPSLQASLPVACSPLRHKELQRQKQRLTDELLKEQRAKTLDSTTESPPSLPMRPQMKPRRNAGSADENGGVERKSNDGEQARKDEDMFPGPLPMVCLNYSLDWADDERDTGYRPGNSRGPGFLTSEIQSSRDRDLDVPRGGIPRLGSNGGYDLLPSNRRSSSSLNALSSDSNGRDKVLDSGRVQSKYANRGDIYGGELHDNRTRRDENSWGGLAVCKDVYGSRDKGSEQNGGSHRMLPSSTNRDNLKIRVTYGKSPLQTSARGSAWDGPAISADGYRDSGCGKIYKRDSSGQVGQKGNHSKEAVGSRGVEQTSQNRYGDPPSQCRVSSAGLIQTTTTSISSFSLAAKGFPVNDPIFNFSKEKHLLPQNRKAHIEDSFMKDLITSAFDGRDPLAPDAIIFRRKKDVLKNTVFYDPVRESFEAELERVQKMQEQERQRVLEEQLKALELARKAEQERERLAREEEERRRKLEEEAREVAWLAEQERVEAAKIAEDRKRAREEEKRQMILEEERRKEAARQKLLELEARIARRQGEASKDEKLLNASCERKPGVGPPNNRTHLRAVDVGEWEDNERMIERLTSSASSESSLNPSSDAGSRPQSSRNAGAMDRMKHAGSWRRDGHDPGSDSAIQQDNEDDCYNTNHDVVPRGKGFSRKQFHGGSALVSNRGLSRMVAPGDQMTDYPSQMKGQRWNLARDDEYNKGLDTDIEYPENSMERFGDLGWRQGQARGGFHVPYADDFFQNSDVEGASFGRLRQSVRQPRVLPPPSWTSMNRRSSIDTERFSPSIFLDSESRQQLPLQKNADFLDTEYRSGFHQHSEKSEFVHMPPESLVSMKQNEQDKDTLRCDSPSSLSVSSPPNSPTHLSHDDIEEAGDSNTSCADYEQIVMSDKGNSVLASEPENNIITASCTSLSHGEEDWMVEDNKRLQEQEEYDEEEDACREEDELREGDEENFDLAKDFRDMHIEGQVQISQLGLASQDGVKERVTNSDDVVDRGVGFQEVSPDLAQGPRLSETSLAGKIQGSNENDQQPKADSSEVQFSVSSLPIQEMEKELQDLVLQQKIVCNEQIPSAYHVKNGKEAPDVTISVQQLHTSVASASSTCPVQPSLSTVSSDPSKPEVPVQVQFGLFSGPSLIPSPLPAIQIGSIRMPLHLHPQVGQSLTQLHSQPPMFQFGQLSYPAPVSQGILPMSGQTVSFVQSTVPSHYSISQQPVVSQPGHESSSQGPHSTDKIPADRLESKQALAPKHVALRQENLPTQFTSLLMTENMESLGDRFQSHVGNSFFSANDCRFEQLPNAGACGKKDAVTKETHRPMIDNGDSQDQMHGESILSKGFPDITATIEMQPSGIILGNRGKKKLYNTRNAGSRHAPLVSEPSYTEHGNFKRKGHRAIHRTEFRVRENTDGRQAYASGSAGHAGQDVSDSNSRFPNSSSKVVGQKDFGTHKSVKVSGRFESGGAPGYPSYCTVSSEGKIEKTLGAKAPSNGVASLEKGLHAVDRNLKNGIGPEEDAALQSGIVRVFKQPGIEMPSNEDNFIEVRSKRQMLNDRREQREKEIKAKSKAEKGSQKPRSAAKTDSVPFKSNKTVMSLGANGGSSTADGVGGETASPGVRALPQNNVDVSMAVVNAIVSLPLPPIGTPAVNTDVQADIRPANMKAHRTSAFPFMPGQGGILVPCLSFENSNPVVDNVSTSWSNACANQCVMTLTQTQLDEAMKPAGFDACVALPVDTNSLVPDATKEAVSVVTQDQSFPTSASSLTSLLNGEKIHFGAVTSPTILSPSSCSSFKVTGSPVSHMTDVSAEHNIPTSGSDCMMFFDKGKHSEGSCVQLEDPEAEAEAAASAVAVAAISNDEPVGNGLNGSASITDVKSYGGGDAPALPGGAVASKLPLSSQSRIEESFSVSLPADLSVETPTLSSWPPLANPQNTSSPMLSHFPGAPHSHFPCYEMNPMLGGPIFTFGPHDEPASGLPQAQKSNSAGSGVLGAWQQCHSGVDSFYGPPAGFAGPFICHPGSIQGVQGPPHMVVYNHFTPVGQFGQMGLRLMGAAYVPTGKQPDWKHTPSSSPAVVSNDYSINNLNVVSGQCDPTMPVPVQHLAPGSPLVPMASPFGLFDISPFQPSADLPVQAHWSHIPAPSFHSTPPLSSGISMPLQEAETLTQQFNHTAAVELTGSRFHEVRSSMPADSNQMFPASDAVSQFSGELGLADASSGSGAVHVSTSRPSSYSSVNGKVQNSSEYPSRTIANSIVGDSAVSVSGSNSNGGSCSISGSTASQSSSSIFKPQPPQPQTSTQQYLNPIGYKEQRGGGATQKGSGSEWLRWAGHASRSHIGGGDENFTTKMKQIYVAKPASNGPTAI